MMKIRRQRVNVEVTQGSLNYTKNQLNKPSESFIAQVLAVYSDRMTCDVITLDGATLLNIPVQTEAGLVDGKPYGRFWLPAIEDYVTISNASRGDRSKMITGTVVPYLTNEFKADAVNSGSKQFTKKLIETGKENHDKTIFKSGTTVEVEEDGTIIIETPRGAYIKIDEASEAIIVEDPHGNIFTLDSSGVVIEDANGNDITMASGKVTINGTNLEVLQ